MSGATRDPEVQQELKALEHVVRINHNFRSLRGSCKRPIRADTSQRHPRPAAVPETQSAAACGWRIRRNPTSFDLRVP